ncbi:MAG TPA: hypothetical protein VG370_21685 [Chloroflexota bacterium]|nr:hypothetical protein [Chloroflexota bacterium]
MQPSGAPSVVPAPVPPTRPPSRAPTLLLGMAIGAILVLGTLVGMAVASRQTAEARPTAIAQYRKPAPATKPAGQDPQLAGRPALVGFVLDVNGDEITVKSRQGPVARVIVGPNTEIRRRRQRVTVTDVRQGDPVVALGRINQQQRTMQARIVVVDPPGPFRERF